MRFFTVLMLALALATTGRAQDAPATLTVTGEAEVAAAPDMAVITVGVTSLARSAADAMDDTSVKTAEILAALAAAGIAERDLQTRALRLNPNWANRSSTPGAGPKIDGFVASNTVMVRVRDLDRLGGVLDTVLGLGANEFGGLSFGLQNPAPAQDEARRAAVAEAMRKAQLYAEAAGLTLGPVLSLSEAGGARPAPMMMEAARMADAVPVAAGEVSVSAAVTMVFDIGG
ncbi:MAG: hypothetical protein CL814_03830 [Confluentimicrobium sp.]|uniref:SIMPL domain-containing protein n=1 Tax=Actibacterium sp. TaxID=1872125 RepID=UPI000C4A8030|nr:SIMPL domain-containing protein [Actibacterium sp.]MBC56047.1 hypothetical protein [Actibacterium sp.]